MQTYLSTSSTIRRTPTPSMRLATLSHPSPPVRLTHSQTPRQKPTSHASEKPITSRRPPLIFIGGRESPFEPLPSRGKKSFFGPAILHPRTPVQRVHNRHQRAQRHQIQNRLAHHPSKSPKNSPTAPSAALPPSLYWPHGFRGALATSITSSYDIVVAGAGIVGTACALEFARSGLTVAIVEPAEIGGGATAAGMGHLAVMDDSPAQFALTSYSQSLWKQLSSQLPPDVEYLPCGSLWVAADGIEIEEVHRKFAYYTARNIAVETLDEQALREAEPNLRPGLLGALLLKEDAVIYPPCAARHFLAEARRHAAEFIPGRRVLKAGKGMAQLDDGASIAAGSIVLANGTAARNMLPGLELQPRKGHLLITDRYPGFVNHQLIELGYLKSAHSFESDSVAFNVQPRKTGQLLIGSSRQYGMEDPAIDSRMLSNMLRRAVEYMPSLSAVSAIRAWTGFRAATPDKLPLIGACPDSPGVYLATGHEGLGISTSLATAKLLADQLLNRESAIPREPYSPTRSFAHA